MFSDIGLSETVGWMLFFYGTSPQKGVSASLSYSLTAIVIVLSGV